MNIDDKQADTKPMYIVMLQTIFRLFEQILTPHLQLHCM